MSGFRTTAFDISTDRTIVYGHFAKGQWHAYDLFCNEWINPIYVVFHGVLSTDLGCLGGKEGEETNLAWNWLYNVTHLAM